MVVHLFRLDRPSPNVVVNLSNQVDNIIFSKEFCPLLHCVYFLVLLEYVQIQQYVFGNKDFDLLKIFGRPH